MKNIIRYYLYTGNININIESKYEFVKIMKNKLPIELIKYIVNFIQINNHFTPLSNYKFEHIGYYDIKKQRFMFNDLYLPFGHANLQIVSSLILKIKKYIIFDENGIYIKIKIFGKCVVIVI